MPDNSERTDIVKGDMVRLLQPLAINGVIGGRYYGVIPRGTTLAWPRNDHPLKTQAIKLTDAAASDPNTMFP